MKKSLVIAALAAALFTALQPVAKPFLPLRSARASSRAVPLSSNTSDIAGTAATAACRRLSGYRGSAFTGVTGLSAFYRGYRVPAFIGATGLSAIGDTAATGVSAYTAATVGAIATAAAGETICGQR